MIAVPPLRSGSSTPALSPFGTWLRGIANNVPGRAAQAGARAARGARRRRDDPLPDWAAARPKPTSRSRRSPDAARDYRDVLTAKYFDGLAVVEIAAASGRSVKAVESLLTRATGRVSTTPPQTRMSMMSTDGLDFQPEAIRAHARSKPPSDWSGGAAGRAAPGRLPRRRVRGGLATPAVFGHRTEPARTEPSDYRSRSP